MPAREEQDQPVRPYSENNLPGQDIMDRSPLTLLLVGIVWVVSIIAGITMIRGALADHKGGDSSWMRRAAGELRFRLRLAAGVGLLTWVILGLIWLITNWN